MIKRYKIFIVYFIFILLVTGCSSEENIELDDIEEELIKQKAISISMATYSGSANYLKASSDKDEHKHLLDTLNINKDKKINDIKISTFVVNDDGSVLVIVEIYDEPFKTVLFHEMTFNKLYNKWVLVDFGVSA